MSQWIYIYTVAILTDTDILFLWITKLEVKEKKSLIVLEEKMRTSFPIWGIFSKHDKNSDVAKEKIDKIYLRKKFFLFSAQQNYKYIQNVSTKWETFFLLHYMTKA